ncbi:hypothetical protein [Bradyrhizobium ivorense]|uniref:hypothetical protein n=1 Tax=Bradyrhizobium ivorense TaxID=2511166 RepID=UPI0010B57594|nr:hypothetical protein [Bradyrhizobium ivorense]VIO77383.1 hypothetical protein CI41S_56380 [Bradyrhizobium ivorense]
MPLIPYADYRPDVTDYEGKATRNILNVIPRGDGYGPFQSFSAYTSNLPGPCRGAFYALKRDGSVITFAATATKLYQLNNTNFTWIDVSKGGGSYIAASYGAQDANWQFAQFGNLVLATQANTVLQVFDLSSSSTFADCDGSPPQAAYISVVGRFLVLSGLLDNPYRIQWSGLNATTTWTKGINSSDFQDFPDGGIVRGVAGGEAGIIFQDQAIRRMSFVPGSPIVFQIDRITQDKGLYAPYSIIRAGERIFFYASQGFHKIEPGGVPEPIGREKVDRTFLADLDKGNLQLFIGAADPRSTRVYWAYKSVSGAVGNTYDKLLGYDFLLDRFFPVAMSGDYLLGISQTGVTLESLDAISSSIDAMTLSLDAYATAVQPEIGQFNSAHVLGFFRGQNLEAILESAEQGTDENRITVRGFRPITDASTLYGSISSRDQLSATATPGAEVLVNARTGRCDLRQDTRYSRFKVRIPAATQWTFCAGVVPDVITSSAL